MDTNVVPIADLEPAAARAGVAIAISTVTDRELDEADPRTQGLDREREVAVWNASRWNQARWASNESAAQLQTILQIISGGSFPPSDRRGALTLGQRRQLRDAMAFQARLVSGRDAFVTADLKGCVAEGRRALLEQLGPTRILTREEFATLLNTS